MKMTMRWLMLMLMLMLMLASLYLGRWDALPGKTGKMGCFGSGTKTRKNVYKKDRAKLPSLSSGQPKLNFATAAASD